MYNSFFVQLALFVDITNIILFQLYLISMIIFLVPICFLITMGIYKVYIRKNILFKVRKLKNSQYVQIDEILNLAKCYVDVKQWLFCILMLEFYISTNKQGLAEYFNCIGFCYEKLKLIKLAKKYYLLAVEKSPLNISILNNLANIYIISGDESNAITTYQKVLNINQQNYTAKNRLQKLLDR